MEGYREAGQGRGRDKVGAERGPEPPLQMQRPPGASGRCRSTEAPACTHVRACLELVLNFLLLKFPQIRAEKPLGDDNICRASNSGTSWLGSQAQVGQASGVTGSPSVGGPASAPHRVGPGSFGLG